MLDEEMDEATEIAELDSALDLTRPVEMEAVNLIQAVGFYMVDRDYDDFKERLSESVASLTAYRDELLADDAAAEARAAAEPEEEEQPT